MRELRRLSWVAAEKSGSRYRILQRDDFRCSQIFLVARDVFPNEVCWKTEMLALACSARLRQKYPWSSSMAHLHFWQCRISSEHLDLASWHPFVHKMRRPQPCHQQIHLVTEAVEETRRDSIVRYARVAQPEAWRFVSLPCFLLVSGAHSVSNRVSGTYGSF